MLTGEPPFVGDSPVAVAYQHVREDPVPPSRRYEGISADLDAVVLKALAKNPENRYQTAAEMRTDLVRVHNGEPPEAPKILTDADRSSLMAAPHSSDSAAAQTDALPRQQLDFIRQRGPGSVSRWVIAVSALAVLTVIVTILINTFGGGMRNVQVPDVRNQASADAIAALQNHGFKTRTQQKPDSTVQPDHVIGTDPAADAKVGAGELITVEVSTGPEQREVPDVSSLSYSSAVKKLKSAGFNRFKQVNSPSTPEMKERSSAPTRRPIDVGDHQRDRRDRRLRSVDQAGSRCRRADRRRGPEELDGVWLFQVCSGRGGQRQTGRRRYRHESASGSDSSGRHGDRVTGVQGQPVLDARRNRNVLDRRRTAVAHPGLDGGAGQRPRRGTRVARSTTGWCTRARQRVKAPTKTAASR